MLDDSDESGFSECSYISGEDAPLPQSLKVEDNQVDRTAEILKLGTVPLISDEYSIAPDMLFGWRPKTMGVGSPIPLDFTLDEAPVCENAATGAEFPTIYHGYRPKDSLVMHKAFSGPHSYPFHFSPTYQGVSAGCKRDTRDFTGMVAGHRSDELIFDSRFESGNLDRVVKIKPDEYDLYMRADANTRGHNQWYFFKVSNKRPQTVKFTIVNFTKSDSLYSQGMQPCVYSKKACASGLSRGWHRAGEHVNYSYSKISRFSAKNRTYWQMSFTYFFQHEDDEVFFAYSIPYTFTRLTQLIQEFKRNVSERILKTDFLCKSLSGVDVPLLTISDFPVLIPRRNIVITCRVHPGETHGSWMLEGLLRYLVSSEACARQLRARFVFYIVPMLNPDGVILGNYRSCFAGNDLNRKYMNPDTRLHPTIFHIKDLLNKTQANGGLFAFLDLHAHSRKKNVFIYGPHYPLHSDKYYKMRVLPKLLSERTEMFRYFGCKFRNDISKKKAARLVVWKEQKLPYSYTLEASFHGYLTPQRTTVPFDEELLMKMGSLICDGLLDYVLLLEDEQTRKERKRLARLKKKRKKGSPDSDSSDEEPQKRTLKNVLDSIRQEAVLENDSDSGGSDSDPSQDELSEQEQKTLHTMINKVMDEYKTLSEMTVRKSSVSRQRPPRKIADGNFEARSSLSKYFSKAGQKDLRERKKSLAPRSALLSDNTSIERKKPPQSLASSQIARRLSACRPSQDLKRITTQERIDRQKRGKHTRISLDPLIPNKTNPAGFSDLAKKLNDILQQRSRSSSSEEGSPSFTTMREMQTRRRYAESPDSPSLSSLLHIVPARPQSREFRSGHTSSQLRIYGRRTNHIFSCNSEFIEMGGT
mmetsp:Transcript_20166/g.37533  ORF Transcript_20166/g.37533 Transcript_20166/m.37533 type:complete len:868 (+) Transcript_20166:1967-4570(+)